MVKEGLLDAGIYVLDRLFFPSVFVSFFLFILFLSLSHSLSVPYFFPLVPKEDHLLLGVV